MDSYPSSLTITNGKPHRPVLLLALAKTVGENPEHSELFRPTDESLLSNYDLLWQVIVGTRNPRLHYPFFALNKWDHWTLIPKPGFEHVLSKPNLDSFKEMRDTIEAVEIDSGLMQLLRNPSENKHFVDEVYARFLNKQATPSEEQLEHFRDQRAEASYAHLLLEPEEFVRKVVIKERDSGDIYVRNADFRRIVPRVYEYRCAVTGRGLQYGSSYSVEACHIEPFSQRQLCTLYNGIALSPDIHKLFDAHYLTIDEDYRVVPHVPNAVRCINRFRNLVFHLQCYRDRHDRKMMCANKRVAKCHGD